MKMGNEIAYLTPTRYKIFLGKGALPPLQPPPGQLSGPHASTSHGETPNMLMVGRDVATPIDLMFTAPLRELDCDTD